jgi:hypothetical protein
LAKPSNPDSSDQELRRRKEQLLQRTMLIASHFAEIAQFDEN